MLAGTGQRNGIGLGGGTILSHRENPYHSVVRRKYRNACIRSRSCGDRLSIGSILIRLRRESRQFRSIYRQFGQIGGAVVGEGGGVGHNLRLDHADAVVSAGSPLLGEHHLQRNGIDRRLKRV